MPSELLGYSGANVFCFSNASTIRNTSLYNYFLNCFNAQKDSYFSETRNFGQFSSNDEHASNPLLASDSIQMNQDTRVRQDAAPFEHNRIYTLKESLKAPNENPNLNQLTTPMYHYFDILAAKKQNNHSGEMIDINQEQVQWSNAEVLALAEVLFANNLSEVANIPDADREKFISLKADLSRIKAENGSFVVKNSYYLTHHAKNLSNFVRNATSLYTDVEHFNGVENHSVREGEVNRFLHTFNSDPTFFKQVKSTLLTLFSDPNFDLSGLKFSKEANFESMPSKFSNDFFKIWQTSSFNSRYRNVASSSMNVNLKKTHNNSLIIADDWKYSKGDQFEVKLLGKFSFSEQLLLKTNLVSYSNNERKVLYSSHTRLRVNANPSQTALLNASNGNAFAAAGSESVFGNFSVLSVAYVPIGDDVDLTADFTNFGTFFFYYDR